MFHFGCNLLHMRNRRTVSTRKSYLRKGAKIARTLRGNQANMTNVQLRLLALRSTLSESGSEVTVLRRKPTISMATIPATTRTQIAKRRSSRMALSVPVGLSGEDNQKSPFNMPAKATNLNRYGAAIDVPRQLSVGSTLTIRNKSGTQLSARVVAQLAVSQGGSVYGIEFIEPGDISNGFWGINFPPLETRGATAQVAEQAGIARRKHSFSISQASLLEKTKLSNVDWHRPAGAK